MAEGEATNSFLKDYVPPESTKPYLLDMKKHKLLGLKDWVAAQKEFKPIREEWQEVFR
jgi:hypothetical protein